MTYEYEGKTEKEAIEMAVADLNLERDQFDVVILEFILLMITKILLQLVLLQKKNYHLVKLFQKVNLKKNLLILLNQ